MTKVIFILHFPPPVHGAAVVGGFIKESKIVNEAFDCRFINLGTSASVEDIGHSSPRKLLSYLSLIWRVNKQLVSFRPDICYFTPTAKGVGFYKDVPVIMLVKLFGVKTIFHYHNKGVGTRQNHCPDNLLYRFVFRNSRVILLSKHLYPDIQKYVLESHVYYCPNGIPEIEDNMEKREGKRTCSVSHILFLSHLLKSKGVLVLVDACVLLKDRKLDFKCTIAGGDAEMTRSELEKIVEQKNLNHHVSVVGPKLDQEKLNLLKSADIFAHPSYNDCMPLILLEAMQFSLPVISTFEGAIPDIVDDCITGFLVPQRDATALTDKLEVLIKDHALLQQLGAAGREKYDREFTLDRFEKRFTEILDIIANE